MTTLESLASLANEAAMLKVEGMALWPTPTRPRVMVVTAELEDWAQEMASRVETLARDAGYRPETRPFHPHVTLARLGGGRHCRLVSPRWKRPRTRCTVRP